MNNFINADQARQIAEGVPRSADALMEIAKREVSSMAANGYFYADVSLTGFGQQAVDEAVLRIDALGFTAETINGGGILHITW